MPGVSSVTICGKGCKAEFVKDEENLKGTGKIVGTVAITIKEDPDMSEPPNSVAWLRRMAVSKAYHRMGIGDQLVETAIKHCLESNFRALELLTTDCHEAARSLYIKRGFEIVQCQKKAFAGGLAEVTLYRLRLACTLSNPLFNA